MDWASPIKNSKQCGVSLSICEHSCRMVTAVSSTVTLHFHKEPVMASVWALALGLHSSLPLLCGSPTVTKLRITPISQTRKFTPPSASPLVMVSLLLMSFQSKLGQPLFSSHQTSPDSTVSRALIGMLRAPRSRSSSSLYSPSRSNTSALVSTRFSKLCMCDGELRLTLLS